MTEVLVSNEKGNDKLMAFVNGTIYKANPKTDQETDILASGLNSGFLGLLGVALYAFIRKAKNPPVMNRIIMIR
jgi:hypothetical protein